jgi:hypothetical protein
MGFLGDAMRMSIAWNAPLNGRIEQAGKRFMARRPHEVMPHIGGHAPLSRKQPQRLMRPCVSGAVCGAGVVWGGKCQCGEHDVLRAAIAPYYLLSGGMQREGETGGGYAAALPRPCQARYWTTRNAVSRSTIHSLPSTTSSLSLKIKKLWNNISRDKRGWQSRKILVI